VQAWRARELACMTCKVAAGYIMSGLALAGSIWHLTDLDQDIHCDVVEMAQYVCIH